MQYLIFGVMIVWLTGLSIKIVWMKAQHKADMAVLIGQYKQAVDLHKGKQFMKDLEQHSSMNLTITPAVGQEVLNKIKEKAADGSTGDSGTDRKTHPDSGDIVSPS